MSGIFEELEMFDESDKVATRQAIAAATRRFNDNFGGFLRQASSKKEFESRLALVNTDIDNMVADIVTEYGGDAEKIANAIRETVATIHVTNLEDPKCDHCKGEGCEHCSNPEESYNPLKNGTGPKTAFEYTFPEGLVEEEPVDPATEQLKAQFKNWFNTQPFPDELRTTCLGDFDQAYQLAQQNNPNFDQMNPDAQLRALIESVFRIFVGGPEFEGNFPPTPNNNPILGKTASCDNCGDHGCESCGAADGRPEHLKAQDEIQLADEHSQVNPWLKKQIQSEDQEDGGNIRNREGAVEDSQPRSKQVPLAEKEGYGGDIDEKLEKAPSAVGKGVESSLNKTADDPISEYMNYQDAQDAGVDTGVGSTAQNLGQAVGDSGKAAVDFMTGHPIKAIGDVANAAGNVVESVPVVGDVVHSIFGSTKTGAAHQVEEKDGKFYVTEAHSGNVAGPFDTKGEAGARAAQLNKLENLEKDASAKTAGPAIPALMNTDMGKDLIGGAADAAGGVADAAEGVAGKAIEATPAGQMAGLFGESGKDIAKDTFNATLPGQMLGEAQKMNDSNSAASSMNIGGPSGIDSQSPMSSMNAGKAASSDNWVNEGDTVTDDGKEKKVNDIAQHGNEKVVELSDGSVEDIDDVEVAKSKTAADVETGDSTETREKLPKGNEDANDGPSPKMDKKKWKPNATNPKGNLKPIETEGDKSPHPTHHQDIKQKPDYQNNDPWENDNDIWERAELPTAKKDEAGFESTRNIEQLPTKTFPNKNQVDPVTREALAKMAALWDSGSTSRHILDALAEEYPEIAELLDKAEAGDTQAIGQLVDSQILQQAHQLATSLFMFDPSKFPQPEVPQEVEQGLLKADPDAVREYIDIHREHHGEEPMDRTKHEPPVEDHIEPESEESDIEEIIERGDDDGDRVEVDHKHEDHGLEDDDEFGPSFEDDISDEELDRLLAQEEEIDLDDEKPRR